MFAFGCLRHGAWALTLFAVLSGGIDGATAKPRIKQRQPAAGSEIPIPKFEQRDSFQPARSLPVQGARFFTIGGALAKFDGRAAPLDRPRLASLEPTVRSASDAPATPRLQSPSDEPFGLVAFRAPDGALWKKWQKVQNEFASEERRLVNCYVDIDACDPASHAMLKITLRASALKGRERYEMVTHAVNAAIRYTSDLAAHGSLDVWASPLESLAAGRGDCEDYAILKYKVLREAGTPAADLQIVLLRDTATREDHAVLAARAQDTWFVLDNRRAGFYVDNALPHYRPLFSLNREGVRLFAAPYAALHKRPVEEVAPAVDDAMPLAAGTIDIRPLLM